MELILKLLTKLLKFMKLVSLICLYKCSSNNLLNLKKVNIVLYYFVNYRKVVVRRFG